MKEKILLVDDEEGIRKVMSISLADSGYNVLTAENGEEALQIFQEEKPAIIITDIKMPGMDGIQLLRKIKNDNPEIEVIIITGHGDMELAIKSLKYEATDFITKPVDDLLLERAIQKSRERIIKRKKLKEYTENLETLLHEKSSRLIEKGESKIDSLQQKLFDEVPSYVTVLDRNYKLTAVNRAFKEDFGYDVGELCYKAFKRSDSPCEDCPVVKTFEIGESQQTEITVTLKDGSRKLFAWTNPLRDSSNKIIHVMIMATDISRMAALQDHLASLGLMVGSVTHAIKGMLTGLDGGVYLLDSGFSKDNPEQIDEGLKTVKLMASRIKNMVLDILYYAKERDLNLKSVNMADFVKDIAKIISPKAFQHKIDLIHQIAVSTEQFEADSDQLRAALVNILENAVDACIEDKKKSSHHIRFSVKSDAKNVFFEIQDNGIGMNEDTKKKLFTLFFSSKSTKGTGIGLFISDKIIKQHGGTIEVKSEAGEGTIFIIKIPLRSKT